MKKNVYVCGDTHGKFDMAKVHLWNQKNELTKNDILIVLGDWAGLWFYKGNMKAYRKDLKALRQWAKMPFTKLIQLGNHENYDLIEKLPTIEKFGGKVYELVVKDYFEKEIIDSIYIMQRGEIYTINGQTLFSMGGGLSQDRSTRTIGIDYWTQELPNKQEEDYGIDNLARYNFDVDFMITHNCPAKIGNKLKNMIGGYGKDVFKTARYDSKSNDSIANYFQALLDIHNLTFKQHHFGHWHEDAVIDGKFFCHYNNEPMQILQGLLK